jgi:PAS domain S-box-containing protein
VDTIDDAVFGCDAHAHITTWSASAARIFGFREDEIVGEPLTTLFPPHVGDAVAQRFAGVTAGEPLTRLETEILRGDGLQVPIALAMRAVPGENGTSDTMLVVARDITEQRLAQARLAEVEERIRESESMAHVGSWLWDVRTGVVQWSDEFHQINGVEPLDFEGTLDAHLDVVHPDERKRISEAMQTAIAENQPFEEEYRVVRPDGRVRWVHARAQPAVDSAGEVVGLRGIGQDVTERAVS